MPVAFAEEKGQTLTTYFRFIEPVKYISITPPYCRLKYKPAFLHLKPGRTFCRLGCFLLAFIYVILVHRNGLCDIGSFSKKFYTDVIISD